MNERFDQVLNREGLCSVKLELTPKSVRKSGNLTMWGAEFDFPTADFVCEALSKWALEGAYPYTMETGSFRELVSGWMKKHRKWNVEPEWVVSTYGISYSLAVAARAFTEAGDSIVSLDPGYDNYWKSVIKCGRKKLGSKMQYNGTSYCIDWDDLEEKLSDPSSKMLVMINPQNPTGKVFSDDELRGIAALARKYDVIIFSDEIFAECVYDGVEMKTFGQIDAEVKVITATSLGKWLSFTGTNQANMIIPDAGLRSLFKEEMERTYYGSINPMMIPAYKAAYTNRGEEWIREFMSYIQGNLETAESYINNLHGFHCVRPEGTFILWVDATGFCGDEETLRDFLTEQAHFHVDMSSQYFGEPGFFRMNLAMPRAELIRNLKSLEKAVTSTGFLTE